MCGISGVWNLTGAHVSEDVITPFTKSLSHRGPDGSGVELLGPVALGHTRLAIQDLSLAGKQPMKQEGKGLWVTFNGEIFNFLEIRRELVQTGYRFRGGSDTEVLLAAFDLWGEAAFEKCNGMWAAAFWDEQKQELLLCRDRFGIKPLYYTFLPQKLFAFASETSAFCSLPGYTRRKNDVNFARAIRSSFSLEGSGDTLFSDIYSLRPGAVLRISQDGLRPSINQWWSTNDHLKTAEESYAQQVSSFKATLEDACRIRLRSDVDLCGALSGGVDSSCVFAISHGLKNDHEGQNLERAFTLTFPNTAFDELPNARIVADYLGVGTSAVEVDTLDLGSRIESATRDMDFVYQTPAIIQVIYAAMRRAGYVVSLEGHGGDELLFGYPDMLAGAVSILHKEGRTAERDRALATLESVATTKQIETLRNSLTRGVSAKNTFGSVEAFKKMSRGLRWNIKHFRDDSSWLRIPPNSDSNASPVRLEDIAYREVHSYRLPTLLRNWDHAAMSCGVESRMPLLDWRVVTAALGLPFESRAQGITKRILRDSATGLIPETIRMQTGKIGINAPVDDWLTGGLRELVFDVVHAREFLQSNVWDGARIASWIDCKESFSWQEATRVWPFVNAALIR